MKASLVLLASLATAPPPAVQVCLAPLGQATCEHAGVLVEGTVLSLGFAGNVVVRWRVDERTVQILQESLADGLQTRHLLLLQADGRRHRVMLEVDHGDETSRAVWFGVAESPHCVFDLRAESIVVETGRRVVGVVRNLGPEVAAGGSVRWLVDGARRAETGMDPLPAGAAFELVLPWDELEGAIRASPLGTVRVMLLVSQLPGELNPADNVYEIVTPLAGRAGRPAAAPMPPGPGG